MTAFEWSCHPEMNRVAKKGKLHVLVKRSSQKPCFITGKTDDCYEVKFSDGTFQGVISWSALLAVLRQRSASAVQTERSSEKPKNVEEQKAGQKPIK